LVCPILLETAASRLNPIDLELDNLEPLDEAETEIQGVPRAMSRGVRSKKTPLTEREPGNRNMLYPKLFGQSGILELPSQPRDTGRDR
jgi:hypothetical protein